jgi:aryl-alcohol dehydrogenase-like predicted oxidoreductase
VTLATRPLGQTGTEVSVLGYGAMELRGVPRGPAIPDQQAGRVLHAVLDSGINLIDTSVDYGRSEDLIGRYLGDRRDEFFLASKCGCPLDVLPGMPVPYPHDYRAENVRANVAQSLRRLRTDRIDLVQVHMSPSRAQLDQDDTVPTLLALRDEGKIRFLGMSGTLPHLLEHIEMRAFDVFQIPYSAVQREHETLITAAADAGAGVLVRGGVARGGPAEDKGWRQGPIGLPQGEGMSRWQAADLDDLLAGMSKMEFMLRFTLGHPQMSTTIVGTSNVDHLRANLASAEKGPLPHDLYDEARRRLSQAVATASD